MRLNRLPIGATFTPVFSTDETCQDLGAIPRGEHGNEDICWPEYSIHLLSDLFGVLVALLLRRFLSVSRTFEEILCRLSMTALMRRDFFPPRLDCIPHGMLRSYFRLLLLVLFPPCPWLSLPLLLVPILPGSRLGCLHIVSDVLSYGRAYVCPRR